MTCNIVCGYSLVDLHIINLYAKIAHPFQTNHELTRVKVFCCGSLFNTVSLMTCKKVIRLPILSYQVEPLRESEVGPTSTSYLRSSRSCLGTNLTSNPNEDHLLEYHHSILRQHGTTIDLSQLMLCYFGHHATLFALEYILPSRR